MAGGSRVSAEPVLTGDRGGTSGVWTRFWCRERRDVCGVGWVDVGLSAAARVQLLRLGDLPVGWGAVHQVLHRPGGGCRVSGNARSWPECLVSWREFRWSMPGACRSRHAWRTHGDHRPDREQVRGSAAYLRADAGAGSGAGGGSCPPVSGQFGRSGGWFRCGLGRRIAVWRSVGEMWGGTG